MIKEHINPLFQSLDVDYLYHFGIDTSMDLQSTFCDVKYVIITRANESAALIAHKFGKLWFNIKGDDFDFKPLFKTERFNLYKVGPVLSISHGFGMPSMLICLNEIAKLLVHINKTDTIFFKVGPSGGLGLDSGSLVISKTAVNTQLEPLLHTIECGKEYSYSAELDEEIFNEVIQFNQQYCKHDLVVGKTIGAFDFYEEQGRLDGFLELPYSLDDRDSYFKRAVSIGVRCIDMESLEFAGFCNQVGITGCIVNAIVVNRFKGDVVEPLDAKFKEEPAFDLVTRYIKHKLGSPLIEDSHENQ